MVDGGWLGGSPKACESGRRARDEGGGRDGIAKGGGEERQGATWTGIGVVGPPPVQSA